jgi:molybdopterin converting factor small subunit
MTVRLLLHATLRQKFPAPADPLATKAATLGELLDEQRIPRGEPAMLFVNGQPAELEAALHEGDEIHLFPLLGGG